MTAGPKKEPVLELPPGRPPERTELGAVVLDRPAELRDLDRLPRTWRGEIIRGTMYAFPRPRASHQRASTRLAGDIDGPFDRGRGGPGGWWILEEPGIELPSAKEFSPDVAGWRRERLPRLPRNKTIAIAPDWICEVLSPRTRAYDLVIKRRFYAQIGVSYLWYVDPLAKAVTASKLVSGQWLEVGAWWKDEKARIEPFEAVELELAGWWEGVEEGWEDEEEPESPSPPSSESQGS
jgi:Uma2 family endonuclease